MSKKISVVLVIVFTALIVGAGEYYFLTQKFDKEESDLKVQLSTAQSETENQRNITAKSIEDAVALTMNTYNKDPEAVFEITKIDGNYAEGGTGSGGGGTGWFAVKTEGVWKQVIESQDAETISCADANQYKFPKTMIPTCLDSTGKSITR